MSELEQQMLRALRGVALAVYVGPLRRYEDEQWFKDVCAAIARAEAK